jgi:hypothetical protein
VFPALRVHVTCRERQQPPPQLVIQDVQAQVLLDDLSMPASQQLSFTTAASAFKTPVLHLIYPSVAPGAQGSLTELIRVIIPERPSSQYRGKVHQAVAGKAHGKMPRRATTERDPWVDVLEPWGRPTRWWGLNFNLARSTLCAFLPRDLLRGDVPEQPRRRCSLCRPVLQQAVLDALPCNLLVEE